MLNGLKWAFECKTHFGNTFNSFVMGLVCLVIGDKSLTDLNVQGKQYQQRYLQLQPWRLQLRPKLVGFYYSYHITSQPRQMLIGKVHFAHMRPG